MIGQTISHYKILEKLGEGGMGVVYKAEDTKLRRSVALKFLTPEMTHDKEAKSRFIHEAQAASALDHPNIAVVHEIDDTDDGQSFICMAYYEGKTLKDQIESGPLDVNRAIRVSMQVADGLQRAHEAGIVHRDIKPANIIVTGRNEVKIVDFGVAKLSSQTRGTSTSTGGTAAYMSPEQAQGVDVDARSDLFSLGVVMYEMLTGKRPFVGEHEAAVMYSIVNIDPVPPSSLNPAVPTELDRITLKLLEKNPENRFPSASVLRSELKHLLGLTESTRRFLTQPRTVVGNAWFISIPLIVVLGFLVTFPPTRIAIGKFLGLSFLPKQKIVAVLPFTNIGNDSTNQAFCDGLMDIFTSKLTNFHIAGETFGAIATAEVRDARVMSPSQAREKLGSTIAVTGSVARDKNRLTIILNVVDTKTLTQVHSKSFEYSYSNLADIQKLAASELLSMLDVEAEAKAVEATFAGNTDNSQAFELYSSGRGYLQNYAKLSNVDYAIQLFQKALQEDSLFALAYAALGESYWRKYEVTKDRQWIGPAVENAEKATKLGEVLSPVHLTLGMVQRGTGNYEQAVTALKQAIDLDSLNSDAHRELAQAYIKLSNFALAEAAFRNAIRIQPSRWAAYSDLGSFYFSQKRYDEAAGQFMKVIDLGPDNPRGHSGLGACYFRLNRRAEAYEALERSVKVDTLYYPGYSNLATNYFFDGAYADAARNYEKALAVNPRDYKVWGNFASALHWSGQREKVREKFQIAVEKAEEQLNINQKDATVLSNLADYHSMLGHKTQALDYMKRSLALAPEGVDIVRRSVDVCEQLGERELALKYLEIAFKKGTSAREIEQAPALRNLRSDTRYKSLVERLGKKP
ncbi:MAG: protein kinase [Ignavibacteriales bacterium]|nr:protein kinase [Ignavibacteriales bacterium]